MKPSGMFLAIEVKNQLTLDKMSPGQQQFANDIQAAGGEYWVVHSYQEFIDKYNRSGWSYQ